MCHYPVIPRTRRLYRNQAAPPPDTGGTSERTRGGWNAANRGRGREGGPIGAFARAEGVIDLRIAVVVCAVVLGSAIGWLSGRAPASIETNENLIGASRTSVDVDDAAAVFQHVFSALPWLAVIYPSGGHYYFSFPCSRGLVQGNLWLTPALRAARMIGMSYSLGVPGRDKTVSVRLGRLQGFYIAAI